MEPCYTNVTQLHFTSLKLVWSELEASLKLVICKFNFGVNEPLVRLAAVVSYKDFAYFYQLIGITDGNKPGGALRTELTATWTPHTGLEPYMNRPSIFPHTYYDYGGKTIDVTAKHVSLCVL